MAHNVDSFEKYRASLSGTETLSVEEERNLAERYRDGDTAAGERIICASLPFVIAVALEYRRWGAPIEDLIQQGNLGLLKAARKFDPSRECRLITYAVYWIRAEIRDYVVRCYRVVRIGTTKGERRAVRNYRKNREDNAEDLAKSSGLSIEHCERILPVLQARDVSLDFAADGENPHIDRLADDNPLQDEQFHSEQFRHFARTRVAIAMSKLPEREAMIVRERMLCDEPLTLEALGSKLGISKERVRQLEERARRRLQHDLASLYSSVA
jgi:RNA polymerase sigma-32 factor